MPTSLPLRISFSLLALIPALAATARSRSSFDCNPRLSCRGDPQFTASPMKIRPPAAGLEIQVEPGK